MGLGAARQRVERLVREQQDVTADTALRLGRVFGTSPDFWLNLQTTHDLSKAADSRVSAATPSYVQDPIFPAHR